MAKARAKSVGPRITQVTLAEYRALHAEVKRLSADLDLRRKGLLTCLFEGAQVEPGKLTAQVVTREVRRFTAHEVARIMGTEVVEEIRTQLRPSIERQLSVTEIHVARDAA